MPPLATLTGGSLHGRRLAIIRTTGSPDYQGSSIHHCSRRTVSFSMLEIKNIYKSFHGTPMSRFVLGAYAPGVDCLLSVSKSSPQFNCCTPHKGDPSRYQGDGKCMRPRRWALFLNQRWKFRDIESSCGCANPGGGSLATRSATLGSWGWLVPPGDRPEVWSSGRATCERDRSTLVEAILGSMM